MIMELPFIFVIFITSELITKETFAKVETNTILPKQYPNGNYTNTVRKRILSAKAKTKYTVDTKGSNITKLVNQTERKTTITPNTTNTTNITLWSNPANKTGWEKTTKSKIKCTKIEWDRNYMEKIKYRVDGSENISLNFTFWLFCGLYNITQKLEFGNEIYIWSGVLFVITSGLVIFGLIYWKNYLEKQQSVNMNMLYNLETRGDQRVDSMISFS